MENNNVKKRKCAYTWCNNEGTIPFYIMPFKEKEIMWWHCREHAGEVRIFFLDTHSKSRFSYSKYINKYSQWLKTSKYFK